MKLEDKLNKASNKVIDELFYSLIETDDILTREDKIYSIVQYYTDVKNYPSLFTDAQVAFIESELEDKKKKKIFKFEIKDLKDRFMIYYNSQTKAYALYDELVETYLEYKQKYTIQERENYGLYRFLLIAYVYAYGAIREEEIEELFSDMFDDFHVEYLLDILERSYGYQHRIRKAINKGDTYYCVKDEAFCVAAIDLRADEILEEFAPVSEEALLAYYFDGYDSTNTALNELLKILELNNSEMSEFIDLIIYTYALMQPKDELLSFILNELRFEYTVPNHEIVKAFSLIDDAYHTYGSWVTKGYSQAMVEQIITDNIDLMNDEEEEEELKEEPIN